MADSWTDTFSRGATSGATARAFAIGAISAALLCGAANSARAAPGQGGGQGPTVSELVVTASKEVAELTVTAKLACLAPDKLGGRAERPKVVSSFPAKGSVVRPGLLVVRVTFNQPMACDGAFTAAPPLENPCPGAARQMLLSYDRRTVRTVCVVEPNVQYGMWISQDPAAQSFLGLAGLPSEAHRITFSTSAEPPATSVCEALVQDLATAHQIRQRRALDCSQTQPAPAG
ncbi:hypothetical protein [Phenylobacterium sp.]|uniref:hypothetical protein n=1 Tax=Phenylobacterium sp. TaxID=1871053 RepID=UPI003569B7BB